MNSSWTCGTIPAITLWEPWATWIAAGLKTIETRGHANFAWLAGKRIAIHASKRFDKYAAAAVGSNKWNGHDILRLARACADLWPSLDGWPLGCVVCTAFVREARWLTAADSPEALCDCGPDRFGLVLADVRVLANPLPWRGGQGVWRLPVGALPLECVA